MRIFFSKLILCLPLVFNYSCDEVTKNTLSDNGKWKIDTSSIIMEEVGDTVKKRYSSSKGDSTVYFTKSNSIDPRMFYDNPYFSIDTGYIYNNVPVYAIVNTDSIKYYLLDSTIFQQLAFDFQIGKELFEGTFDFLDLDSADLRTMGTFRNDLQLNEFIRDSLMSSSGTVIDEQYLELAKGYSKFQIDCMARFVRMSPFKKKVVW